MNMVQFQVNIKLLIFLRTLSFRPFHYDQQLNDKKNIHKQGNFTAK